jgi:hypothetical protein
MLLRRVAVLVLGALVCGLLAGGCKKPTVGPDDAGAPGDAGRGLANVQNDKEIVALAKAAAGCPPNENKALRSLLDIECPAFKDWQKGEPITRSSDNETLLDLIEDGDAKMRWLGALALLRVNERWKKDKAAAVRVVAATEDEKDKYVGYELGLASSVVDLRQTGLVDRVIALIRDTKRDPWLRGALIPTLGYNGKDGFPEIREAIEGIAREDGDGALRGIAVRELWYDVPSKECALFRDLLRDPQDEVAGFAVEGCEAKGCEANIAPMLDEIQRRAKAGEAKNEAFASALWELGKTSPPPAPATRARLLSIAEEIVKNDENASLARSRAIEALAVVDPRAAAAFAGKYTKDADVLVAAAAKKVAAGTR